MRSILLVLLFTVAPCSQPATAEPATQLDFLTCKDNGAIDAFLRESSPLYAAMARIVELHGRYKIEDKEGIGIGMWNAGERVIQLDAGLVGAQRASVIAFEMTNAYQQQLHTEVDMAVDAGEITTQTEFALRHELIEYDGLRIHREVLGEIEKHLGKIPPAFFLWSNPKPASVSEYQLPMVMDFLKQMKASGHTAYYYQWFETRKKQVTRMPATAPLK
jgi:hypothetical protein